MNKVTRMFLIKAKQLEKVQTDLLLTTDEDVQQSYDRDVVLRRNINKLFQLRKQLGLK